ncbi:MAG: IS4/IS5 family transposase, partial [Lachnospiraceae bacterium]
LSHLKTTLDNCIAELDEIHCMFCKNPDSDFTKNRKISFHDYIQLMLQMQSSSVSNELLDFFEHSISTPSKSAFTQQRYKLQPEVWNFLFRSFVAQCRTLSDNLYQGYRLLACDGSDVNISHNPSDERTFVHEGAKDYNTIN